LSFGIWGSLIGRWATLIPIHSF